MIKSLILKEWLKTRVIFLIALAVMAAIGVYTVLTIRSQVATRGVVTLWLAMLLKNVTLVGGLRYLPALTALAIGVSQWMPEMSHKRFKLTLHLPVSQGRLVGIMLACGVAELLAVYLLQLGIVTGYYATILAPEMLRAVAVTLLPWYLAGFAVYFFVAAVCIEPATRRRALLAVLGASTAMFFYLNTSDMAPYSGSLLLAVVIAALPVIAVYGSVSRFKTGIQ